VRLIRRLIAPIAINPPDVNCPPLPASALAVPEYLHASPVQAAPVILAAPEIAVPALSEPAPKIYDMSDCVFCDIVAGKAPASFVYQDDLTLAFMDISTLNPGQTVVIPRKHFPYMADIDEATGRQLFNTTMRVSQAIRNSGLKCDGINLFLADGEAANQEIFHLHFLIIPRLKGDSMKVTGNWTNPARGELDEIAARIRRACETPH
jgi:histidine triad (HIT) family protein